MADTRAKTDAAKQKLQQLENEYQEKCKELSSLIANTQLEGSLKPPTAGQQQAVPIQQLPVRTAVVTPAQVNGAALWQKMLTKPGLEGMTQQQADAMTVLFLEHMNEIAVTADIAPLAASGRHPPPPTLSVATASGGGTSNEGGGVGSVQVQLGEEAKEDVLKRMDA